MRAVEKKLGGLITWLIILTVALVTFGVASIVALEPYVPIVHVVATHPTPSATQPITNPSLPPAMLGVHPASGPGAGGNRVIIVGSHLEGASTVKFGSIPAMSYTVNTIGTEIIAYPPAQASRIVDVTLTTSKGTSVVGPADQYTYLGPTVTKIAPKTGTSGATVIITGVDLNGATAVMFGGTPATSFVVGPISYYRPYGTQITAVAPTGHTGPVDIVVTTPGGSSTTGSADVFTDPYARRQG